MNANLLTAAQAAALLGCSARTVRRMVARGDLIGWPAPGNGNGKISIPAAAVRRMVDDMKRAAARDAFEKQRNAAP